MRDRLPYLIALAVAILAVCLVGVALAVLPAADQTALLFEIAKACVGVVPVAIFGVLVADLLRQRDRRKDRAQRQYEYRREFRAQLIEAYNGVKHVRRALRGAGLTPKSAALFSAADLQGLDSRLETLIGTQLALETLKREARAARSILDGQDDLARHLERLETFVNFIVKDWEKGRPDLAVGTPVVTLESWSRYAAFVADHPTPKEPDVDGSFRVASDLMEDIEAVLIPLVQHGIPD